MFKDIKVEEAIVYLMLIVVGYYIAKMFSRSCNGFSVGGQTECQTLTSLGAACVGDKMIDPAKNTNIVLRNGDFNYSCCK